MHALVQKIRTQVNVVQSYLKGCSKNEFEEVKYVKTLVLNHKKIETIRKISGSLGSALSTIKGKKEEVSISYTFVTFPCFLYQKYLIGMKDSYLLGIDPRDLAGTTDGSYLCHTTVYRLC